MDEVAERRMFAKTIIDSDAFLDMPTSAQNLYFHLGMRADDDGFVNNPKKIQKFVGGADDDLKLLIAKRFIIPFESGICVIKHWKIHNYIQNDRYKATVYQDEKSLLDIKENGSYTLADMGGVQCIQDVSKMETQVRLGKDRLGKVRKDIRGQAPKFTPPTIEEVKVYCQECNNSVDPERWLDFYSSKGWMIGKNKMKDWKAAVRTWEKNTPQDKPQQKSRRVAPVGGRDLNKILGIE